MKPFLALVSALAVTGALAQSSMDQYRWYLAPRGQEILISVDDLHDERIFASPRMDWGRASVPDRTLREPVVIAVIDGGFDIEHPELRGHVALNTAECYEGTTIPPRDGEDKDGNGYKGDCAGWDFVNDMNRPEDEDAHGTHVTGIINTVLQGVRGEYKFLSLKAFAPDEGQSSTPGIAPLPVRVARAFDYAVSRGADVIHLSVGWPKSFMTVELENAIKKAQEAGVMVVAAAGNSSQRATIYPCQLDGVVCVGALRANGDVARFSNWGTQVDILAPGEKILSTIPMVLAPTQISRRGYDFKNGTSQAAPFVTAALAMIKGAHPEGNPDQWYARLMLGADAGPEGKALRGLFHLDRALDAPPRPFVFPVMKGLHGITLGANDAFSFNLPLKNFWLPSRRLPLSLSCPGARLRGVPASVPSLASGALYEVAVRGTLTADTLELDCQVQVGTERTSLKLKVLRPLGAPVESITVVQPEPWVVSTRTGARSRFLTLNPMKGVQAGPLYYVAGAQSPAIYAKDRLLGQIHLAEKCKLLRLWQVDLQAGGGNEILLESLCNDEYLSYRFFDQRLSEFWPQVKYKPALTIVNYDEFEVLPPAVTGQPPRFRFLNGGFATPPESPWESPITSRALHYYELFPVRDGADAWKYDIRMLERPDSWARSLNLRFTPDYTVLHLVKGRLLVKMGRRSAWVNLQDHTAVWAPQLDRLLLEGTKRQPLGNTTDDILQGFLTPYEYRGHLLDGITLAFGQTDRHDPLVSVIGTWKNRAGFLTVLQSFQKLLYLQYDTAGALVSTESRTVDRFDFLSTQDLLASVVGLENAQGPVQIVDGTRINTNYVDRVSSGRAASYEIPSDCVTQVPVSLDGTLVLPLFCAKSRTEFEMRFHPL